MSLWKTSMMAIVMVSTGAAFALGEEPALSRSIYVPVKFAPGDHLEKCASLPGGRPAPRAPGTHIFQYTHYANLSRIEPELERVRIQGKYDGAAFRSEVIVTPASVYIGKKKVELDLHEQMTRLRRNNDARHDTIELSLKCSSSCRRSARLKSAETSP